MKIIRKQLAPLAAYAYPTRYDEVTDTVEVTYDGGITWEAFPEGDPRRNNHTPPLETADPRCDAAARIAAGTQEAVTYIIDQIDFGATALPIVQGLIRLLTPLFTLIPYLSLFYTAVSGILAIGSFAMHAAFDTFDWDAFTCLVYNNLAANGRLTAAGFELLLADIATEYGDTQETVLYQLYANTGFAGLNDQAGIRSETGDCSACPDTWCYTIDCEQSSGNAYSSKLNSTYLGSNGAYIPGQGWVATLGGSPTSRSLDMCVQLVVGAQVTEFSVVYDRTPGQYTITQQVGELDANGVYEVRIGTVLLNLGSNPGPSGVDLTAQWLGNLWLDTVGVFIRCSFRDTTANPVPTGSATLKRITLRGTGTNPFGDNNCGV